MEEVGEMKVELIRPADKMNEAEGRVERAMGMKEDAMRRKNAGDREGRRMKGVQNVRLRKRRRRLLKNKHSLRL